MTKEKFAKLITTAPEKLYSSIYICYYEEKLVKEVKIFFDELCLLNDYIVVEYIKQNAPKSYNFDEVYVTDENNKYERYVFNPNFDFVDYAD